MNLPKLLEVHIGLIRRIVRSGVIPPCGDLLPMCAAFRSDASFIAVVSVELTPDRAQRQSQHVRMMQWLQEQGAAAYGWAAPAWGVTVPAASLAMVTAEGVEKHPDRQETVVCVVGDKDETLSMELLIMRGADGRILELKETRISRATTGLFHDMLLQPRATH